MAGVSVTVSVPVVLPAAAIIKCVYTLATVVAPPIVYDYGISCVKPTTYI